ncbi:neuronal acetylcholine receptor subunit alpha-3-like [Mercenaria mercenaria]|uniref:neuronal acetylcholine receptor subunit alpha-3-like n=1 Tax=Mercenaria mercenaria TaxID=6596 RepID=UPI00234F655C|nr:neuronal acetylcholine receptor subunit alpha-3-like [Mercenaria mercenaria]
MKILFFLLLYVQVCSGSSSFVTGVENLISALTSSPLYNADIRPQSTVNVSTGLTVISLDLDSHEGTFSVSGRLTITWYDAYFVWTPTSYSDIEVMHVKDGEIWRPELVIENMLDDISVIYDEKLRYRVHYSGTITWEQPVNVRVHCPLDFTYYPFDKQTCGVTVSSWSYDHSETPLYPFSNQVNLNMYHENSKFDIVETNVEAAQNNETRNGLTRTYSKVTFYITVRRHTQFYGLTITLPLVLLSALTILTFLLPVESGEKANYSVTLLLMIVVFYTAALEYIPVFTGVSVLVGYISVVLILATLATLCDFLMLYLYHQDKHREMKPSVVAMLHILAKITCKLQPNEDTRSVVMSEGTSSTRVSDHDLHACSSLPDGGISAGLSGKKPGRLSPINRRVEPCESLANNNAVPGPVEHRDSLPPLDSTHPDTRDMAGQTAVPELLTAKKPQVKENSYNKSPWQEMSKCLDRLFLIMFLVISIITHLVFLTILGTGSR